MASARKRQQTDPTAQSAQAWWRLHDGVGPAARRLAASIDCEIVIVGGGATGALVALALAERGLDNVVVVDRGEPALGGTAAAPGILRYEFETPLTALERQYGIERAARAWLAASASIELIESLLARLGVAAGFRRTQSLCLAARAAEGRGFEAEVLTRRGIGLDVRLLDGEALRSQFGIARPAALWTARAAEVDPVALSRAALDAAVARGVRVYGGVDVRRIDEETDGVTLRCGNGVRIQARAAAICAGAASATLARVQLGTPRASCLVATEPAVDVDAARARPLLRESASASLYSRTLTDGRTIVGGADEPMRDLAAAERTAARRAPELLRKAMRLIGRLPPAAHAWSAPYLETVDGLPLIGRAPGGSDRVYHALCDGPSGLVMAMHAAEIIATELGGGTHELAPVFGFERLSSLAVEPARKPARRSVRTPKKKAKKKAAPTPTRRPAQRAAKPARAPGRARPIAIRGARRRRVRD